MAWQSLEARLRKTQFFPPLLLYFLMENFCDLRCMLSFMNESYFDASLQPLLTVGGCEEEDIFIQGRKKVKKNLSLGCFLFA